MSIPTSGTPPPPSSGGSVSGGSSGGSTSSTDDTSTSGSSRKANLNALNNAATLTDDPTSTVNSKNSKNYKAQTKQRDQVVRYQTSSAQTQSMGLKSSQQDAINTLSRSQPNLDAFSSAKPLPLSDDTMGQILDFQMGPQSKAVVDPMDFLPGEGLDPSIYDASRGAPATSNSQAQSAPPPQSSSAAAATAQTTPTTTSGIQTNKYIVGLGPFAAATSKAILEIISANSDMIKSSAKLVSQNMKSSYTAATFSRDQSLKAANLTMGSKIVTGSMGMIGGSISVGAGAAVVMNSQVRYGGEKQQIGEINKDITGLDTELMGNAESIKTQESAVTSAQAKLDQANALPDTDPTKPKMKDEAQTALTEAQDQLNTLNEDKKTKTAKRDDLQKQYDSRSSSLDSRIQRFDTRFQMFSRGLSELFQGAGQISSGVTDNFATKANTAAQFAQTATKAMADSVTSTMQRAVQSSNDVIDQMLQAMLSVHKSNIPQR